MVGDGGRAAIAARGDLACRLAAGRVSDRGDRAKVVVVQVVNLCSVPDPDMRVGVGQNLLVGAAEIADLDRAEGRGDAALMILAQQAGAVGGIGVGRDRHEVVGSWRTAH